MASLLSGIARVIIGVLGLVLVGLGGLGGLGIVAAAEPLSAVDGEEPRPSIDRPIRLAFEPTPNPPRYLGEGTAIDWEHPGLTLDLLRLVAERLEIAFTYARYPWKRALFLLETDQVDGVFHASFVPDRMRFGVYPMTDGQVDPRRQVFEQSYVFYSLQGSSFRWDGTTATGIGLPVGVTTGYSVIKTLERLGLPIETAPSKSENLRKLVSGRLSAVADLENMTDIFIRQNPERYGSVRKVMPAIVRKPYYLILSHGFYEEHRALAEAIWDEIANVNKSEAFAAIEKKYAE